MEPSELEVIAGRLFGQHWRGALARALGVDYTTLWRQVSGDRIPGPVQSAVRAWQLLYDLQGLRPPPEPGQPFLPPGSDTSAYAGKPKKPKRNKKITAYARAMLDEDED